jgi:hypothetical protein
VQFYTDDDNNNLKHTILADYFHNVHNFNKIHRIPDSNIYIERERERERERQIDRERERSFNFTKYGNLHKN